MTRRVRTRKALLWQTAELDAPTSPQDWTNAHVKALVEDGFLPSGAPSRLTEIKLASEAKSCYQQQVEQAPSLTDESQDDDWIIETTDEGAVLRARAMMVSQGELWMHLSLAIPLQEDGSLDSSRSATHDVGMYKGAIFSDDIEESCHRFLQRLHSAEYAGHCEFSMSPEYLAHWPQSEDQLLDLQYSRDAQALRQWMLVALDQFCEDTLWTPDGVAKAREQVEQTEDLDTVYKLMCAIRRGGGHRLSSELERWFQQAHPLSRMQTQSPEIGQMTGMPTHADDVPVSDWELGPDILQGWQFDDVQHLLSDEWADDQGRRWRIRPVTEDDRVNPISVRKRKADGSAQIIVDGDILCASDETGGEWVDAGDWRRKFHLLPDGKFGPTIEHSTLHMDSDYQRLGFARQWLARCSEKYVEWGIENISLQTGLQAGARVWPRMGFKIVHDSDSNRTPAEQIQRVFNEFKEADEHQRDIAKQLAERMQEPEYVMEVPFERWKMCLEMAEVQPMDLNGLILDMLQISSEWMEFYDKAHEMYIDDPFNSIIFQLESSVEQLRYNLDVGPRPQGSSPERTHMRQPQELAAKLALAPLDQAPASIDLTATPEPGHIDKSLGA